MEKDMKTARKLLVMAWVVVACGVVTGDENTPSRIDQEKRDQIRIAVQKICPISGNNLGDHGAAIKVKVGAETVFLCCKGCLKKKINAKHWATIHANFAKAQRICPVMKHELPERPKWVIVEGQIVFVCCPPCTKKIVADPKKYLRQVEKLYTASLEAKTIRR
jgi:hypothetical protein